jgi:hypothetical protein
VWRVVGEVVAGASCVEDGVARGGAMGCVGDNLGGEGKRNCEAGRGGYYSCQSLGVRTNDWCFYSVTSNKYRTTVFIIGSSPPDLGCRGRGVGGNPVAATEFVEKGGLNFVERVGGTSVASGTGMARVVPSAMSPAVVHGGRGVIEGSALRAATDGGRFVAARGTFGDSKLRSETDHVGVGIMCGLGDGRWSSGKGERSSGYGVTVPKGTGRGVVAAFDVARFKENLKVCEGAFSSGECRPHIEPMSEKTGVLKDFEADANQRAVWDRFLALCGNDGTMFHPREEGNDGIIRVPSGDKGGVVGVHVGPQESPVRSPKVIKDGERRLAVIEQYRVAEVREKRVGDSRKNHREKCYVSRHVKLKLC